MKRTHGFKKAPINLNLALLLSLLFFGFPTKVPAATKPSYPGAQALKYVQNMFKGDTPPTTKNFKPIKVDFKDGHSKGWSGNVQKSVGFENNEIYHFLGPFPGDGKVKTLKKFNIKTGKFKLILGFWVFKFWKNKETVETQFSPLINDRVFANYTYTKDETFKAKECKILKSNLAIKDSGFAATQFKCTYNAELTPQGNLIINGNNIPSAPGKPSPTIELSVKSSPKGSKGPQKWGIWSFEITPIDQRTLASQAEAEAEKEKKQDATEMEVPRGMHISFVIPKTQSSSSYPVAESAQTGYTRSSAQPLRQTWSYPRTPPYPPSIPSRLDYTPPDTTAGPLNGDIPKCTVCFEPNLRPEQSRYCQRECVPLSRQTAIAMDTEKDKLERRLKELQAASRQPISSGP